MFPFYLFLERCRLRNCNGSWKNCETDVPLAYPIRWDISHVRYGYHLVNTLPTISARFTEFMTIRGGIIDESKAFRVNFLENGDELR